jgi:hypothetical protein
MGSDELARLQSELEEAEMALRNPDYLPGGGASAGGIGGGALTPYFPIVGPLAPILGAVGWLGDIGSSHDDRKVDYAKAKKAYADALEQKYQDLKEDIREFEEKRDSDAFLPDENPNGDLKLELDVEPPEFTPTQRPKLKLEKPGDLEPPGKSDGPWEIPKLEEPGPGLDPSLPKPSPPKGDWDDEAPPKIEADPYQDSYGY